MSYLAISNYDKMFENLTFEPILINKVVCYTENDRKKLNKLLTTVYESDSISSIPRCECGELYGQYNIGITCPECGTPCKDAFDTEMTSRVWLQIFPGIKGFIAPPWWWRLNAKHTYQGFNMIKWLTDPLYHPPVAKIDKALLIEEYFGVANFKRDINYFHDNFDIIMELLTFNGLKDNPQFPIRKSAYNKTNRARVELYEFIMKNREKVFCQYLPVPDKALFVIESNDTGSYGDIHMEYAINAIKIVQHTQQDLNTLSFKSLCHRVVKVIDELTTFYDKYLERNYYKKKANFRQHVYGGRLHFTGRAVISSITAPHNYDELYVPWGFALHLFKLHVVSKLIKRGYELYEINDLIRVASHRPHPVIREIFDELINEAPHKGIPVIFQRNPTLHRGSGQLLYITRIKDEIEDHTISISVLVITALNADFDGDELNVTLLLDQERWENFKNLEPHHNIMSATDPFEISDILKVQPQIVATTLNWMNIKQLERQQNAIKSNQESDG